jgi:hypothetical protein
VPVHVTGNRIAKSPFAKACKAARICRDCASAEGISRVWMGSIATAAAGADLLVRLLVFLVRAVG